MQNHELITLKNLLKDVFEKEKKLSQDIEEAVSIFAKLDEKNNNKRIREKKTLQR